MSNSPLNQIWQMGLEALLERLGPVGMIRFLHQVETGHGDYTAERDSWLTETDLDALVVQIHQQRQTQESDDG